MNKIAVIGSAGSGKSTLSLKMTKILDIQLFHLDALFWQDDWKARDREEWRQIQDDLVNRSSWIIDGNYSSTLDIRLNQADTIIFLDMKRSIRIYRVIKRYLMYRKKSRPDMNPSCKEKLDLTFMKWIWNYDKEQKPKIMMQLNHTQNKKIIILKSPKEVDQFISSLER